MDIKCGNGTFTWTNRHRGFSNIAKKLDRFFFKEDLLSFKGEMTSTIETQAGSNHYLVVLDIVEEQRPLCSPFKFENMWMKQEGFFDLIDNWWKQKTFIGSKLFCFVSKIKAIKAKLLKWNREKLQNIFSKKKWRRS